MGNAMTKEEPLAQRLRVLRAARGLSLTEAWERTGVHRDTISGLERGGRHPSRPTLEKLAKGYGIPLEELRGEEYPAPTEPASSKAAAILEALDAYEGRLAPGSDWASGQGIQHLAELKTMLSIAAVDAAGLVSEDEPSVALEIVRRTATFRRLIEGQIAYLATTGAQARGVDFGL